MRGSGSTLAMIVVGMAMTLPGFPARADVSPDRAAAEALAVSASALLQKGEYREACAQYTSSAQIDPTARRFLNLGDCQLKAGLTASAWLSFVEARDRAERNGDGELSRSALKSIEHLQNTLAYIEIVVQGGADVRGLEVRRDGILVSESARGLPVAVDPGPHVIAVQAPGRRPWSTQLGLTKGGTTVTVTIPTLETDPEGQLTEEDRLPMRVFGGTALVPEMPPPDRAPEMPPPPDLSVGRTQRTIAWVLAGASAVSLTASIGFGLAANSTKDDVQAQCPAGACSSQSSLDLYRRAESQAAVSNVFLGLGIASLVGAGIVYFTAPSPHDRSAAFLRLAPMVAQGTGGLLAAGRF
jgi:hypothetical protein